MDSDGAEVMKSCLLYLFLHGVDFFFAFYIVYENTTPYSPGIKAPMWRFPYSFPLSFTSLSLYLLSLFLLYLSTLQYHFFLQSGISMSSLVTDGLSVTYSSNRTGSPDLRLIHYNDVYHVEYALLSFVL